MSRRQRVVRRSGLLWPGFSKRIGDRDGVTFLWGVPIGRFDVTRAGDSLELRYRRWPIVDVLRDGGDDCAGYVRLPGARRVRFCRFTVREE